MRCYLPCARVRVALSSLVTQMPTPIRKRRQRRTRSIAGTCSKLVEERARKYIVTVPTDLSRKCSSLT